MLLAASGMLVAPQAWGQYADWAQAGRYFLLTTAEGADLPEGVVLEGFPVLVSLAAESFPFAEADPTGADLRVSAGGQALSYQIEEWDPAAGRASLWVRVPEIRGQAQQELTLHWGKPGARSESDGAAVFNASNGYASVLHLDDSLRDEVGTLRPVNAGSTAAAGRVGAGRHFAEGQGIAGGEHIKGYPSGDQAFSSEAWFRSETAGAAIFAWGRYATRLNGATGDGNEVDLMIGAPPRVSWASDGPAGASSEEAISLGEWHHAAATYADGKSCLYVDGRLHGSRQQRAAMSLMDDVYMYIGGMRGSYQFAGDIDEVRVSRVARSAAWMKLQYENQRAQQTLVGRRVEAGSAWGVEPGAAEIVEGGSARFAAQAGGALKLYWILQQDGRETVLAVDQGSCRVEAGRLLGDKAAVLRCRAVFPDGVRTKEMALSFKEAIPEPIFRLRAPTAWDGRTRLEVVAEVSNAAALAAAGAGELAYRWKVSGGAVLQAEAPGKLVLERSQYSGPLTVTLGLSNGGAEVSANVPLEVRQPERDAWVVRVAGPEERPEEYQFYARDDHNLGTLHYRGALEESAEAVFVQLLAEGKPIHREEQVPGPGGRYAFSLQLKPGLIRYAVEFGVRRRGREEVRRRVDHLACGDAYLIDGQSNAEATGPNNGPEEDPPGAGHEWIRSFGNQHAGTTQGGWGPAVRTRVWGRPNYGEQQIGTWGMVLARRLVERYRMPICILNGAYGGTPIWQHQVNPKNRFDSSGAFYRNPYKIYGSLLTRVAAAHLTHGIRSIFWHQGENDQGSGAPTGDYNWKSYQQYFVEMAAAWKRDYPNVCNYYAWQIWPSACSMGGTPAGDHLLDEQRTLPRLFSNLRLMSSLGIASPSSGRGLCHYDEAGYAQLAELISPLVEQDHYGLVAPGAQSAPNVERVRFASAARDELILEFGQPMAWREDSGKYFRLDGAPAAIVSGAAVGDALHLKLKGRSEAKTVDYLAGKDWDGTPQGLVEGANGIAALTFCEVVIGE